jgi:non-ribosomal peptide synthetase component F
MFALQNSPLPHLDLPGISLSSIEVLNTWTSKFDLFLSLTELPGGLAGNVEYNTDLFNPGTIKRLMESYRVLLEGILAGPDAAIAEVSLLDQIQQRKLLVEWNATLMEYPRHHCIHQLFEAQVRRTPQAVAVAHKGQSISYRELDQRANQLAHFLQKLGVRSGSLVGILINRSVDMVIALLGALKAGAAYAPLDPAYPRERLEYILSDTQAKILITQEDLASSMDSATVQTVCMDTDWQSISRESQEPPDVLMTSANPAYVIHTSGSTGKPKGVQVPHRAVVNFLSSMAQEPGLNKDERPPPGRCCWTQDGRGSLI